MTPTKGKEMGKKHPLKQWAKNEANKMQNKVDEMIGGALATYSHTNKGKVKP